MGEINVSSQHLGRLLVDGTGPQASPYRPRCPSSDTAAM